MKVLPETGKQWLRFGIVMVGALIVIVIAYLLPFLNLLRYSPQEGDILFQPLFREPFVKVIEGVTESSYSHCGVVLKKEDEWQVIAAWGSVHYKSLYSWIRQGRMGQFSVYRLKPEYKSVIPGFLAELDKYNGRPYDYKLQMDDDTLYCSELIFKAFKQVTGEELGKLIMLKDLNYRPYKDDIKKISGGTLPLEQLVIPPKQLSEADQIEKVFEF